MNSPLRIGIVGMGGYAGSHHETVFKLEEKLQARLICTCDPHAASFAPQQQAWRFAARGVSVYSNYSTMLEVCAPQLDLLVVPTPLQFHAEMHRAGVNHHIPVYLEKPPTLDYRELETMIQCERAAPKASMVGFNFIVEKPRLVLKQRLLDGEFGAIIEARLLALSARPIAYFQRNHWSGRLMVGDRIVLDSCFGNDLAHFVHNLLFWAGKSDLLNWAEIAEAQAELYRAHPIESADTFFVQAKTADGVQLRFGMSQAHAGASAHSETIVCEKATLRYVVGQQIEIRWNQGRTERISLDPFDALLENHLHYYRYLRGEIPRPATMLTDARPFVRLNALAFISSGEISTIPATHAALARNEKEQKDYYAVAGMESFLEDFLIRGRWPSTAGWNRLGPASVVSPTDLARFESTVKALVKGVNQRS